jgi:hypothetical protein
MQVCTISRIKRRGTAKQLQPADRWMDGWMDEFPDNIFQHLYHNFFESITIHKAFKGTQDERRVRSSTAEPTRQARYPIRFPSDKLSRITFETPWRTRVSPSTQASSRSAMRSHACIHSCVRAVRFPRHERSWTAQRPCLTVVA